MSPRPTVEEVDESDNYVHVRFRDPDDFETIRTPDWAANAASSVVKGAEVRTGKTKGTDDWEVQSVLIPDEFDENEATSKAQEIFEKIES